MFLIYISLLVIIISYLWVIIKIYVGWTRTKIWRTPVVYSPKAFISVLVPVRNEEKNIESLLLSLSNQRLPNTYYEIIIIDDHSDDKSLSIASSLKIQNLKTLSLSEKSDGKGKKAALAYGIEQSKGDLIVTVDADCKYGVDWLINMISYFEINNLEALAGPVLIAENNGIIASFQSLDVMGSVATTASGIYHRSHFMAFGANFMYLKSAFQKHQDKDWRPDIVSGDDMFLMEAIAMGNSEKVGFLKNVDSTAITHAETPFSTFVNQRKRWAGKSGNYKHRGLKLLLTIVFIFNTSIWISLFIGLLIDQKLLLLAICFTCIKILTDLILLKNISRFFHQKFIYRTFFLNVIFHSLYILIAGIYSLFSGKYEWKGRLHS